MKAKDLKNSILQMAVQGKLVPQDPNDEPASALLERIRAERAKLIKNKKIKAPKGGESVIYRASDGSHYEKRLDAKGRVLSDTCIEGEIPFEIPEGWEWARLLSVCTHIVDGDHNPPANAGSGVPIFSAANVHDGKLNKEEASRWITQEQYEKHAKRMASRPGCVLLTIVGTIGRTAVVQDAEPYALQRSVCVIGQLKLQPEFVSRLLESYASYLQSISSGTAQKGVYLGTISSLLVPLPPLAEQRRIVAVLGRALSYVDEIERSQADLCSLNAQLQAKVLDLAVRGELVSQATSDEPASALLERIRAERAKLIKDKKIKAPKGGESVIYRGSDGRHYEKRLDAKGRVLSDKCIEGEIPFELPEGWEWARLSSIASVLNGDRGKNYPAKSRLQDEGIPFVSAINIENRIVSTRQLKYLSNDQFVALKAGRLQRNDIVFCIRGSLGKFGIFPFEEGAIASSLVIVRTYDSTLLTLPYLSLLLEASITTQQIEKHNNGTAQPNLAAQSLMDFVFPIPPLAEQRRIAEKVAELNALITNR